MNTEPYISSGLIEARRAPDAIRGKLLTKSRVSGLFMLAAWGAFFIGIVWFLYSSYDADYMARYAPKYVAGFWTTLQLVFLSLVLGGLISLPIAFGRMSSNLLLNRLSFAYIYFFRGTPLLAQLFLLYYGFGQFRPFWQDLHLWWLFRDSWSIALLSFTLNTAAYQAEILRGAIMNVPRGQIEGAKSLGLPKLVTFFKVILPQALIVALRPYGNEIILMVKGSAVVSIISVYDLMGETRRAFSQTYDFQAYIYAAIFYLLFVEIMRRLWDIMEDRLTRHLRRDG
ncbi:polar amino acid transport system permease protein [Cohaesibacter sp. ES.047]|uniref:ABC transporter permease n=1 Tax=Cohaesibacter sp. ES.047 TaxID=1798205 RepID=UPI000BBFEC3A|nr:ABC transporter permease [Cohaesibacter sp. ES.047]SNY93021.1 polar amino acid transport system permease protein [Cohaesibacter sp. ES.047]